MGAFETRFSGSGDRVAIDLPAELGFAAGTLVRVEKVDGELRITAVADQALSRGKARLTELTRRLREIGPITPVTPRDAIEFPDRPGLY